MLQESPSLESLTTPATVVLSTDASGRGAINVLAADQLMYLLAGRTR